jgi:hypothetical protein
MNAPFIQGEYTNVTMLQFNSFANSYTMDLPYVPGGYTSLLMGVDQSATTQDAVRKLYFDEST